MLPDYGTIKAVCDSLTVMKRPRPPLDSPALEALGLRYVERFATTRRKLADYLERKVRERGWTGDAEAPDVIRDFVERCARHGYVDDAAYAQAKARDLAARGYGARRLDQALFGAGVEDADAAGARELARDQARGAAMKFARRKRVGPFAAQPVTDRALVEKAIAAFVRAGHSFATARTIIETAPGGEPDWGDDD